MLRLPGYAVSAAGPVGGGLRSLIVGVPGASVAETPDVTDVTSGRGGFRGNCVTALCA